MSCDAVLQIRTSLLTSLVCSKGETRNLRSRRSKHTINSPIPSCLSIFFATMLRTTTILSFVCIVCNSHEASAFVQGSSRPTAFVSQTQSALAASTASFAVNVNHAAGCGCPSCRTGHGDSCSCANCRVGHDSACGCANCQVESHGPSCACTSCASAAHDPACVCGSCSAGHGLSCGCPSCRV